MEAGRVAEQAYNDHQQATAKPLCYSAGWQDCTDVGGITMLCEGCSRLSMRDTPCGYFAILPCGYCAILPCGYCAMWLFEDSPMWVVWIACSAACSHGLRAAWICSHHIDLYAHKVLCCSWGGPC